MTQYQKEFCDAKIIAPEHIEEHVEILRGKGNTIATLNGSFDLLHAGHLNTIYVASKAADILIVAMNSDASIKKYKSADRPIIPLAHRMQMMAAIAFVDFVTWFDETDPRGILATIRPNIHINGAEYGHDCIEAETVKKYGGEILVTPIIKGLSTTQIINTIKVLCD